MKAASIVFLLVLAFCFFVAAVYVQLMASRRAADKSLLYGGTAVLAIIAAIAVGIWL